MKYGIRRFLNPVVSWESGWVHFTLSTNKEKAEVHGITSSMVFADCHQQITLEFDIRPVGPDNPEKIAHAKKEIRRRRRKIRRLRKSVNSFAKAYLAELDRMQEDLDALG